jgi:hypothetical protein
MEMSFADFKSSLSGNAPPPDAKAAPLQALWWAGKGDWEKAHTIVMADEGAEAAWVHAYLHRVEGDLGNAGYWYRRAGKPVETSPLETEWAAIVESLLGR